MDVAWENALLVFTSPESAHPLARALAFALFLFALDVFITSGPFAPWIRRVFQAAGSPCSERAARKLPHQVAARIAGCVFLAAMFPHAIRTLTDERLQADKLYATSPDSTSAIVLAAGYFMYDVFICTYHLEKHGGPFLLHALLCCAAYWYPIFYNSLHYFGSGFLMWELSTPLLYLRWLLLKTGHAEGKWMKPANLAFVAAFFACRIAYGPVLSWHLWVATQADLAREPRPGAIPPTVIYVYYVAMLTLNTLNYYWFSGMVWLFIKDQPSASGKVKAT